MPTYEYLCDEDDGGCGNIIEVSCLMSERENNLPKSCPKCKKRKSIRQLYGVGALHMPSTLGSLADKQTGKMSDDEKHHLTKKHNAYKETNNSWESTPHGIKHIGNNE